MALVLRNVVGRKLTYTEMDDNFSGLADGSLTTFTASGTGAIARTGFSKDSDIVSVKDFGAVGDGVTDDTAAIQAAFNAITSGTSGVGLSGTGPAPAIYFPSGNYKISSTITMPNSSRMVGDGRWATRIFAAAGFTGIMIQDKGNASKIIIEDLTVDANDEAGVTDLINLGNLTSPWGTAGYAANLYLRAGTTTLNAGTCGIRHKSNVLNIINCDTLYCDEGFVESGGTVTTSYINCSVFSPGVKGIHVNQNAVLTNIEIESPSATCVPIYVARSARLNGIILSLGGGAVLPHAIEIDASAQAEGFSFHGVEVYLSGGATLTDLIEDNRSGFPLHWGESIKTGERHMSLGGDALHISLNKVFLFGHRKTNFKLRITNTAGTLQHKITSVGDNTAAGAWVAAINGASATLANTPTGADASTAMASGGKISTGTPSAFILDTADHATATRMPGIVTISANTTGQPLMANLGIVSRDVNGVTRKRLELYTVDATTGASFALSVANIAAGEIIDFIFDGYLVAP